MSRPIQIPNDYFYAIHDGVRHKQSGAEVCDRLTADGFPLSPHTVRKWMGAYKSGNYSITSPSPQKSLDDDRQDFLEAWQIFEKTTEKFGKTVEGYNALDDFVAVVIGDEHIPYQHEPSIALAMEIATEAFTRSENRLLVRNGDVWDNPRMSRFGANPREALLYGHEAKSVSATMSQLFAMQKDWESLGVKDTILLTGNHDIRYFTYITSNATEVASWTSSTIVDAVRRSGIIWPSLDVGHMTLGNVKILHGNYARKVPGSSVRGQMENDGMMYSTIQNHIHRMNLIHFTKADGRVVWGLENGCMCQEPMYTNNHMNWQRGFSILTKEEGEIHIEPVLIYPEGATWKARYNGKTYTAK